MYFSAAGGEIFNLCVPDLDDRISESDIIRLIRQILEGLCCLHEKNIVHLDLKVRLHQTFFLVLFLQLNIVIIIVIW